MNDIRNKKFYNNQVLSNVPIQPHQIQQPIHEQVAQQDMQQPQQPMYQQQSPVQQQLQEMPPKIVYKPLPKGKSIPFSQQWDELGWGQIGKAMYVLCLGYAKGLWVIFIFAFKIMMKLSKALMKYFEGFEKRLDKKQKEMEIRFNQQEKVYNKQMVSQEKKYMRNYRKNM